MHPVGSHSYSPPSLPPSFEDSDDEYVFRPAAAANSPAPSYNRSASRSSPVPSTVVGSNPGSPALASGSASPGSDVVESVVHGQEEKGSLTRAWEWLTDCLVWRHTFGRASCAVRFFSYGLCALGRATVVPFGRLLGTAFCGTIRKIGEWRFEVVDEKLMDQSPNAENSELQKTRKFWKSWTKFGSKTFILEQCEKDCLRASILGDRCGASLLAAIFVPPPTYHSLWESLQLAVSHNPVLLETNPKAKRESMSIKQIDELYRSFRPQLSKCLTSFFKRYCGENYSIYAGTLPMNGSPIRPC